MALKLKVPSIKLNKKLLPVSAIIVLVVLAGLVAVGSYHHYTNLKQKQDAQAHTALVASQKAQAAEQAKLNHAAKIEAAYNSLYVECSKGLNVYNSVLTPAQKLQVQRLKSTPNCGPAEPVLQP